MNRLHYVYISTNLINNKKYIGQRLSPHGKSPESDCYFGSGILITKAVKKYGKEKFSKEIIFETESQTEADRKEIELIKKYDCLNNKDKWYNRAAGGQYDRSENHSKEMSFIMKEFYSDPVNIKKALDAKAKKRGFKNHEQYKINKLKKQKIKSEEIRKKIEIKKLEKEKIKFIKNESIDLWKTTELYKFSLLEHRTRCGNVYLDKDVKKKHLKNKSKSEKEKLREINNPLYNFLLDNNLFPFTLKIKNINVLSKYRSGTYKTIEGLKSGLEKLNKELLNNHYLFLNIDELITFYENKYLIQKESAC